MIENFSTYNKIMIYLAGAITVGSILLIPVAIREGALIYSIGSFCMAFTILGLSYYAGKREIEQNRILREIENKN